MKNKYSSIFPKITFGISHPFVREVSDFELEAGKVLKCVFVGKFEYQKGADLFLELIARSRNVNWTIAAISNGSEKERLRQVPPGVQLYLDLNNEEVLNILKVSDILIFPSRTEGFGIAILEALSKGVVPIVLDIPIGIPDQVEHGYNGFIVPEKNWSDASLFA